MGEDHLSLGVQDQPGQYSGTERKEERKEGRKEGRKRGRKEGRKEKGEKRNILQNNWPAVFENVMAGQTWWCISVIQHLGV
jgi:hypothetical protein